MSIAPKPLGHICEHCGQSNLSMRIPDWSNDRPTKQGWYLVKRPDKKEYCVFIELDMDINNLIVRGIHFNPLRLSNYFDDCQWRRV